MRSPFRDNDISQASVHRLKHSKTFMSNEKIFMAPEQHQRYLALLMKKLACICKGYQKINKIKTTIVFYDMCKTGTGHMTWSLLNR